MSAVLTITADDRISRCIIFNPIFDGEIHTNAKLWLFGKRDKNGISHHSAVLRRLAPREEDVHEIGCKIAAAQNAEKSEPPPGDKRRYYCGCRTALVSDLTLEIPERFRVDLIHHEENGISAHVDVALTVFGTTTQERANQRTEAGMALVDGFGPPSPHTCACDADDDFHPIARWGVGCLTEGLDEPFASAPTPTVSKISATI